MVSSGDKKMPNGILEEQGKGGGGLFSFSMGVVFVCTRSFVNQEFSLSVISYVCCLLYNVNSSF